MKIKTQAIIGDAHRLTVWLYSFLRFFFLISLIAIPIHYTGLLSILYFIDLFSHFTLQYAMGGLVLGALLLVFQEKKKAAICFCIFFLCLIETRWTLDHPLQFSPTAEKPVYRVATYNHNVGKRDFQTVRDWLTQHHEELDAVVIQEANAGTSEMAESLRALFPYQIHEPRDYPFGMVILSKYEFVEPQKISLPGPYFENMAIHFSFQSPKALRPLAVYAVHSYPPAGPLAASQRDYDLLETARYIGGDKSQNIVMMGDFNLTPFAPVFGQVLDVSDLNYQSYGLLLNPTWPSFNMFDFLRIPIDHVFYSDGLIQIEKQVGASFGSDHHILIVGYAENR